MQFEARELRPYREFVKAADLVEGHLYFRVSFLDTDMQVPEMVPLILIGRDPKAGP